MGVGRLDRVGRTAWMIDASMGVVPARGGLEPVRIRTMPHVRGRVLLSNKCLMHNAQLIQALTSDRAALVLAGRQGAVGAAAAGCGLGVIDFKDIDWIRLGQRVDPIDPTTWWGWKAKV